MPGIQMNPDFGSLVFKSLLQWGSEIRPIKIQTFEGGISDVPDHSKTGKNEGFSEGYSLD